MNTYLCSYCHYPNEKYHIVAPTPSKAKYKFFQQVLSEFLSFDECFAGISVRLRNKFKAEGLEIIQNDQ